jgi:HK97 gp10 family phage protein
MLLILGAKSLFKFDMRFDGLEDMQARAKQLGITIRAASDIKIKVFALKVLKDAVKGAPYKTGALRRSGRVEKLAHAKYAVSFGGGGTLVDYAADVEFGTFKMQPRPFLLTSMTKHSPGMTKEIGEEIRKEIDSKL